MLYAVIGTSAGKTRDEVMAIYPRHKAFIDQFIARGEVVGVGPFIDPEGGNMALFRSKAAAEEFAKSDPFFTEGAIKDYKIKEWRQDAFLEYLSKLIEVSPHNFF